VVIGWFYLFGGRSGARQIVAASIIDRLMFVPVVLVPLAIAGVFPHLFFTFVIFDASLAISAWALVGRVMITHAEMDARMDAGLDTFALREIELDQISPKPHL
jgi:hypothetical protein